MTGGFLEKEEEGFCLLLLPACPAVIDYQAA